MDKCGHMPLTSYVYIYTHIHHIYTLYVCVHYLSICLIHRTYVGVGHAKPLASRRVNIAMRPHTLPCVPWQRMCFCFVRNSEFLGRSQEKTCIYYMVISKCIYYNILIYVYIVIYSLIYTCLSWGWSLYF